MDFSKILSETQAKFDNALSHFDNDIKKVRTGRAQPDMLDGIMVMAYGASLPLIQTASISTPEPQLLQISPFDPNNLQAITNAIRENTSLGLNPMDDGRVIRVSVPPLTEERRKEYVKILGSKVEDCMVALRSIRHSAINSIDQGKKDKSIGEDDARRYEKQIDEALNKTKAAVESKADLKQAEIMKI